MINANHWNLRGPVRSMRSEIAERDLARSDWQAGRFFNYVVFDEAGRVLQLDQRGAGDSIFRKTFSYDASGRLLEERAGTAGGSLPFVTTYRYDGAGRLFAVLHRGEDGLETTRETSTYDESGRRTRVQTIEERFMTGHVGFGVDGSEFAYGARGARTLTTVYDHHDRPTHAEFLDPAGTAILRVVFTRDDAGRVLKEEAFQSPLVLPVPAPPDMTTADREALSAAFSQIFGSIRTTNEYDQRGRLARRTRETGMLGGTVTTFSYTDHGDVADQSEVSTSREGHLDANGRPEVSPDVIRYHDVQFSYEYDTRENWISRVVSSRFVKDGVFAASNIERRTLDYYWQA